MELLALLLLFLAQFLGAPTQVHAPDPLALQCGAHVQSELGADAGPQG